MEWLGSIAWDGYPESLRKICQSRDESEYRNEVAARLCEGDDGTTPDQGWPWPWSDSGTTDYAYAYDNAVWCSSFGSEWKTTGGADMKPEESGPKISFADMTDRKAVTFGPRSGLMIFRV